MWLTITLTAAYYDAKIKAPDSMNEKYEELFREHIVVGEMDIRTTHRNSSMRASSMPWYFLPRSFVC